MNSKRQLDYDLVYMNMAECVAQLSYAQRSKVGCVIVTPQGQVISQGFNGTPTGMDNCCEELECDSRYRYGCIRTAKIPVMSIEFCKGCERLKMTTKKEVLHAESNAITKCAKNGCGSTDNSTIYVTLSPCYDCAKLIIQAGITRLVYKEQYRLTDGLDLLVLAGIQVDQIDTDNKKIIPYKK